MTTNQIISSGDLEHLKKIRSKFGSEAHQFKIVLAEKEKSKKMNKEVTYSENY